MNIAIKALLIVIICMTAFACHKEKAKEKDLSYYFNVQNEVMQHGRRVLSKYFADYKQKLVDRNIAEILCLPRKNTVRDPWHFECKITTTDKKVMIIKEDAPFHVVGQAYITTEPFVVSCDDILEVSVDDLNRKMFQYEFDRLLVLFDKRSKKED